MILKGEMLEVAWVSHLRSLGFQAYGADVPVTSKCISTGGLTSGPWDHYRRAAEILDSEPVCAGWRDVDYIVFG